VEREGKLGQGFASVDRLEEMDIRDGNVTQLTYVNTNLTKEQKDKIKLLPREFVDCFAWNYNEMSGLGRDLVEHRFKQPPRKFNPLLCDRIKEEVNRLLEAGFIRPCRYVEWVSNIVPVEKKNTGKFCICVDFRNLNRVTPKDEYQLRL
jgi:hypothetical protein